MRLTGVLAGLLVGMWGLSAAAIAQRVEDYVEPPEINVCDVIAEQVRTGAVAGDVDVLMHTVGCAARIDGSGYDYTEYVDGGGCNTMAWAEARAMVLHDGANMADDGGWRFALVREYVLDGRKDCEQFADGTYGDKQLIARDNA